jgi:two-component system sensor kinase FixL
MSAGKPTRGELVRKVESVRQQLEREREVTARMVCLASAAAQEVACSQELLAQECERLRVSERQLKGRLADMQLQLHHASRLAAMGELAAGIAHEVNQPLCSIVNFANACRNIAHGESADLGQIQRWSDAIASSAAQAGDMIRRLISFARRTQADREVVRVQQLFDDAILLVQHEARVNRVAIRLATADPDLTVHAQPIPIHQVMVNLLRNSIDALGADLSPYPQVPHRQVVVQAAQVADGVEITVLDNGPGVPESVLPKIFEPFYTTKPRGLGLGLVISRTIVEDHGGKIWAAANRDGGLAVHFTLPAGRDESHDDAQQNGIRD